MAARHLIILVVLAGTVAVAGRQGVPANTLTDAERRGGWKLLFDGKSLGGWKGYDPAVDPSKGWTVEDGCLKNGRNTGRPASGGGDIVTVEQFVDFDFRFDWRISRGGNSGVKYLVLERLGAPGTPMYQGDDGRSAIGHEYQVLDDDGHPDARVGPQRQSGAFYDVMAPNAAAKRLKPVGEFNESRILVQGKHVEHWLNGAKLLEYELDSAELAAAIAKSKFKNVTTFAAKAPTRILLQDHGDEVWFRNLRIRTATR